MPQILLVCDEPLITSQVQTTLNRQGYLVETVSTEEKALVRLASDMPNLLIQNLAEGVGDTELWHSVRHNQSIAELPMLLIVAKADWGPGFEANPYLTACLTKPFHPMELSSNVQRLLMPRTHSA